MSNRPTTDAEPRSRIRTIRPSARLSLTRSMRAARMPGVGNLGMAALYVVPAIAVIVAPGKPGNTMGVNPSVGAWVLVLIVNLLHAAMLAAFAFRYLAVADEVPEPAPRERAGRR